MTFIALPGIAKISWMTSPLFIAMWAQVLKEKYRSPSAGGPHGKI
jgi:hypothetical protein